MSIIFSQDFGSDPRWSRQSLNESPQNSFDHVPGGARDGYLRASVDDVSPIWYDLQTSPAFGPVSSESDFEITFGFNPIRAAWGTYPEIRFANDEVDDQGHPYPEFRFSASWSDSISKQFDFAVLDSDGQVDRKFSPTFTENRWYDVGISNDADTDTIDLRVDNPDGTEFYSRSISYDEAFSFDRVSVGDVQGTTDYGSLATIGVDDISISQVSEARAVGSNDSLPEPVLEVTFDEAIEDSSANGFPLQAVGTRPAEDRFGTPDHAIQLNGTSDFVDLPEAAFNAAEGTISIWVKPDDDSSGQGQIFSSADFGSPSGSRLYLHFDSDQGVSGSFLNHRFDHVNISFDQWTHLALTWSDDVTSFYVDGVLSETTSGGRPAIERVTLGAYGEGFDNFFKGALDDFKAFGEALSDNDIGILADSGPDGTSAPDYGLISEPTPVSEDYEQIIDDRFGVDAQLAAWETLSARYEAEGGGFLRESGLVPTGEDGFHGGAVTAGGERFWSGDRHYLARWGEVPSSFASHDSVSHDGVPLHLGSWYSDRPILAELSEARPDAPGDDDPVDPLPDPDGASPVDTAPLAVSAPDGWEDDGSGGVVNAGGGDVFLGHAAGATALLRVESGTVGVASSGRVSVDGDVYAVRGGPDRPLFTGSFAVEPGDLNATGFAPRSDSYGLLGDLLDIDFSGLTFSESDVALDADLDFPAPLDALDTSSGPLTLRYGAEGLSFGPGRVGTSDWLPDINLPLSVGMPVDLSFSDLGMNYDGPSQSLYLSGEAALSWGGTLADQFGTLGVPAQGLEFDLAGDRDGGGLVERGDKFLRLKPENGELAWDVVGDISYTSDAGFLRDLSLGVNTIDETFSGSVTGALGFASDRTLTGDITGLWNPVAIDSVSFGMGGLNLPVASTGLFLQGGALGVDGLAAAGGGSGTRSYSGTVDYTYGSATGGLPTPFRGDIGGSFSSDAMTGSFSIRSTPGYILGDAASGGIVDVMETYFGLDASAVLDFALLDASGEIEANFARDSLYAELDASVLGGLLDGEAELTSFDDAGVRTIDFGARGAVQIPDAIGFGLGGRTLADANVAMEYSADQDFSNDFFAAWGSVGPFTKGFQVSFDGDFDILNRTEIEKIGSWELAPENEVVLISAKWETAREGAELVVITPDGTRLSEVDLSARDDITIAEALTTPTSRHVTLETPAAGIWDIEMIQPNGLGEITYSASEVLSGPSLDFGITSDDYAAESAQLTLTADGMAAGSEIVINALTDPDDAAGVRLQLDALQSEDGTQTVAWDYAEFDPGTYHLEAVARGGGLAPEATVAETEITVDALLEGSVTGLGGAALPDTALRFTVDGAEAGTAQADAQGAFALRAPPETAGQLAFEREVTARDTAQISASDALDALRLAVGLDPSWGPADGFDFVAADFNGDGAVTASDALDILRIAVGLDTGSNQPRWVFGDLEADDVNANDVPNLDNQIDIAALTADAQVNAQGVLVGNMEDYIV